MVDNSSKDILRGSTPAALLPCLMHPQFLWVFNPFLRLVLISRRPRLAATSGGRFYCPDFIYNPTTYHIQPPTINWRCPGGGLIYILSIRRHAPSGLVTHRFLIARLLLLLFGVEVSRKSVAVIEICASRVRVEMPNRVIIPDRH